VSLLKETNAAGDLIGNAAPRKFQLQFDRVIMRTVKNCDFAKIDIFIAQLQDSLRNELRLFRAVVHGNDRGFHRV